MIFNFNCNYENLEQYPDTISSLNGKPIENVKSFKYLGDIIKCDESSTGDAELELRIILVESKFYELIKKLTNHHINLKTRVLILNSLVRTDSLIHAKHGI